MLLTSFCKHIQTEQLAAHTNVAVEDKAHLLAWSEKRPTM